MASESFLGSQEARRRVHLLAVTGFPRLFGLQLRVVAIIQCGNSRKP